MVRRSLWYGLCFGIFCGFSLYFSRDAVGGVSEDSFEFNDILTPDNFRGPLKTPYDDHDPNLLPSDRFKVSKDPKSGLDYDLSVWAPKKPGQYPVFFFLTGLNGIAPPDAYKEMLDRLAKRGVIVVAPAGILMAPSDTVKVGMRFIETIYWMDRHLGVAFEREKLRGIQPDMKRLMISAHSSAVKTIMELYRSIHGRIAGLVLIDPVNLDPFGMTPPAIQDHEQFDYSIPTLFLASGLGALPGRDLGKLWPPCAPEEFSAAYFYRHFSGQKWFVRAKKFGHGDMLGSIYYQTLRGTAFCKVAEDQNPELYRLFLSGAIASFAHGVIGQDVNWLKFIEDSALIPTENELYFER